MELAVTRRYAFLIFVIVIGTATVLAYWPKPNGPMVAVNETSQASSVSLTLDTGATLEYAMPPLSAVLLPISPVGTVTGAVVDSAAAVGLVI